MAAEPAGEVDVGADDVVHGGALEDGDVVDEGGEFLDEAKDSEYAGDDDDDHDIFGVGHYELPEAESDGTSAARRPFPTKAFGICFHMTYFTFGQLSHMYQLACKQLGP